LVRAAGVRWRCISRAAPRSTSFRSCGLPAPPSSSRRRCRTSRLPPCRTPRGRTRRAPPRAPRPPWSLWRECSRRWTRCRRSAWRPASLVEIVPVQVVQDGVLAVSSTSASTTSSGSPSSAAIRRASSNRFPPHLRGPPRRGLVVRGRQAEQLADVVLGRKRACRAPPGTGPPPVRRRGGCAPPPGRRGGTPRAPPGGSGRTRRPCRNSGGIPATSSSLEPEETASFGDCTLAGVLGAQVQAQAR